MNFCFAQKQPTSLKKGGGDEILKQYSTNYSSTRQSLDGHPEQTRKFLETYSLEFQYLSCVSRQIRPNSAKLWAMFVKLGKRCTNVGQIWSNLVEIRASSTKTGQVFAVFGDRRVKITQKLFRGLVNVLTNALDRILVPMRQHF